MKEMKASEKLKAIEDRFNKVEATYAVLPEWISRKHEPLVKEHENANNEMMSNLREDLPFLFERVKELTESLILALLVAENHIHSEYDGTDQVDDLLAELDPVRKVLEK